MHRTFGSLRCQSQNHSNLDITLISRKICREILRKQQKKYYENVNLVLVNAAINHTKHTQKNGNMYVHKLMLSAHIIKCQKSKTNNHYQQETLGGFYVKTHAFLF